MDKSTILLSAGVVPWLNLTQSLNFVKKIGFDGLEFLPARRSVAEIEKSIKIYGKNNWTKHIVNIKLIKSMHQSWRLDSESGIFFGALRLAFFPSVSASTETLRIVSSALSCPLTVHDLSPLWVCDTSNKALSKEIFYEIFGVDSRSPKEIKEWLKNKKHKIVVDTRDDQSLLWAKKHGFYDWRDFWNWVGIENIGNVQVTLIGIDGMKKILNHSLTLAEEQLLWLHKKRWIGSVTVEANPLMLILLKRGDMKKGLRDIAYFVRTTLENGQKWS